MAATRGGLDGSALGASLGAAVFLVTACLGLAALVFPFRLRTPPVLLLAPPAAALLVAGQAADGRLGRLDRGLAGPPRPAMPVLRAARPVAARSGPRGAR